MYSESEVKQKAIEAGYGSIAGDAGFIACVIEKIGNGESILKAIQECAEKFK